MNEVDREMVWLLATGDGSDGDEWNVQSIHATESGANAAKLAYERIRTRPDGSTYHFIANVEGWNLGP